MKKKLIVLPFLLFLILSCKNDSGHDSNPLDLVTNVSFTGTPTSSRDELFDLAEEVGPDLEDVLDYTVFSDSSWEDFEFNFGESSSPLKGGLPRVLTNQLDFSDYTGSMKYTFSENYNLDNAVGSLDIVLSGTTENNLDFTPVDIGYSDDYYAPADLSIFGGSGLSDGEGSLKLSAAIDADFTKITIKNDATGLIAFDRFIFDFDLTTDIALSNVDGDLYEDYDFDVDSASLDFAFNMTASAVAVVSSTYPDINGGKIIMTTSLRKNLDNLDISGWDEIYNSDPDAFYDFILGRIEALLGDLDSITCNVTVYDNNNAKIYSDEISAQDFLDLIEGD